MPRFTDFHGDSVYLDTSKEDGAVIINADADVFLLPDDARALAKALKKAAKQIERNA